MIFEKVKKDINKEGLKIKGLANSGEIPAKIKLDENFLNFVGLWFADGCYDQKSIIVSVQGKENRNVVRKVADTFDASVKLHSDNFSLMINSVLLRKAMREVLELKGNSYTKKMPSWVHDLSNVQVGWLLKGFFSGDGCTSDKEVVFSSCSKELISDISSMLLRFGIVLRIGSAKSRITPYGTDNTISCRIGHTKMIKKFMEDIGFLVKSKQEKLKKLSLRSSTHDVSDIIPLPLEIKEELSEILGRRFNKNDYITRGNNLGREHLSKLLIEVPKGITNPIDPLRDIVKSDIFWDRVETIKKVKEKGYVYDISVPEHENFICENIIAHNTMELPTEALRKFGYNIQPMKVRSALAKTGAEVSADEGIRASLRLGDSSLIVGEIRSTEAFALYEAMRVGALANVVAGTIHGDSPYGVFDRVVNDLQVPRTSFKATDIIVIANPIRSPDGLHKWRRVTQITEVRKEWEQDPLKEGGFVDLMKYDSKTDTLQPTDALINGESEIVKSIAGNVKEWAGNWDAVWDNILLRARMKDTLVKYAQQTKIHDLLEAPSVIYFNDLFHKISNSVKERYGYLDSKRIFLEWEHELRRYIKKEMLLKVK